MTRYLYILFVLMLSLVARPLNAEILIAEGLIKVKGDSWEGTRITILPEFGEPYELPLKSNRFELELGLQASYLVRAEHMGCPTKEVFFDCRIPALLESWDFRFPFEITLEKLSPGAASFTYAQPVGLVYFDTKKEDFNYTTDYSRITEAPSIEMMKARMNAWSTDVRGSGHGTMTSSLIASTISIASTPARLEPLPVLEGPLALDKAEVRSVSVPNLTVSEEVSKTGSVADQIVAEAAPMVAISRELPTVERKSMVSSSRTIHSVTDRKCECGTHQFLTEPNKVIVIDRVHAEEGCVELRKVVHAYGGVFYFHDGRSVTQPLYEEVLTARHSD